MAKFISTNPFQKAHLLNYRNTLTRAALVVALASLSTCATRPASAALIYGQAAAAASQQSPGYAVVPFTGISMLDNFTLATPATLRAIDWTGTTAGTNYAIRIFQGAAPPLSPSTAPNVFSSTFAVPTPTGLAFGQTVYTYTLASDVTLGPGNYWLGIQGNGTTVWQHGSGGNGTSVGNIPGVLNFPLPNDFAFNLYDAAPAVAPVPEPGTWAMMVVGAAALALPASLAFKRGRDLTAPPTLGGLAR